MAVAASAVEISRNSLLFVSPKYFFYLLMIHIFCIYYKHIQYTTGDYPGYMKVGGDGISHYWQSIQDNKIYNSGLEEDKKLNLQNIMAQKPEQFRKELEAKGITINDDSYIRFFLKGYFIEDEFICTNDNNIIGGTAEKSFAASTFMMNPINKHHMKDILLSPPSNANRKQHALFLTSAGAIFSYGNNVRGQCGIGNISSHELEADVIIKTPFHLQDLSTKFITNIYIGDDFSIWLDKDKNLYCGFNR